jgi:hypothetical protein
MASHSKAGAKIGPTQGSSEEESNSLRQTAFRGGAIPAQTMPVALASQTLPWVKLRMPRADIDYRAHPEC